MKNTRKVPGMWRPASVQKRQGSDINCRVRGLVMGLIKWVNIEPMLPEDRGDVSVNLL